MLLDGKKNYPVVNPTTGKTITDIDLIQGGVLWEEKSAVFAGDIQAWVNRHIKQKFESYMEARKLLPGYENAPIGFKFTAGKPVDAAFEAAIVKEIDLLRQANPGVQIRLEW